MNRSMSCVAVLLFVGISAGVASADTMLTGPVDGMSYYYYYVQDGVTKTTTAAGEPVLDGLATYPWYKERKVPLFEFAMDASLYGQSDLSATFHVYVTEAGDDCEGDGVVLGYYEGDGVLEYHGGSGTSLGTVDPTITGWRALDVSAAVQAAADAGWSHVGLSLYPDDWYSGNDSIHVAASENTDFAPYIQVVPEPASMTLMFLGTAAVALRRRRAA